MRRPLLALALAAFALHAVQGALLGSPWLLPDELHSADAARDTAREGFPSLWALLTWPLWAAGTEFGYEASKLLGAAAVAAASYPAFAMARLVATDRAALVAAAVSVLAPETALASTAHPAAVAYPFAAAATLWVVTRRLGRAAAAGALAVAFWPPLAFVALPVALLAYVRVVTPRRLVEWPAAAALAAAPALLYALVAGGRLAWAAFRRATDAWDEIPLSAGASIGALAIGLALVPVVVGVGAMWRREAVDVSRTLLAVLAVELVALGLLAGTLALGRGGTRGVDEVALLPLLPPLAAATAHTLGRLDRRALGAAAVLVGIGILLVPTTDDVHAPGLALADALGLGTPAYSVALTLLGVNAVAAFWLLRGRDRVRIVAPSLLAVLAAALVVPGELAAWSRARDVPDRPLDLAALSGGRPVTLLPVKADPRVLAALLFWTPKAAIAKPPIEQRALVAATGVYVPPLPPGLVLDFAGARIAGVRLAQTPLGTLVDGGASPRAAETIDGLYSDSWSGGTAHYRRFGGAEVAGVVVVRVSRANWQGPRNRSQVVIDASPIGGEPFSERITSIDSGQVRTVRVPVPPPPFELRVAIATFSPADYGEADDRKLGAQLAFDYRPGA